MRSGAVVAERVAGQLPGIERIERAPSGELRGAFSNAADSDVVLVDPATAAVIAPTVPADQSRPGPDALAQCGGALGAAGPIDARQQRALPRSQQPGLDQRR